MALPSGRRTTFIRRSIQRQIGNSITTATGNTYPVIYGAPGGFVDPEGVTDDDGAQARGWADVTWLGEGAGRRSASFMQVDFYYRHGAPGDALADPWRQEIAEMIDTFTEFWSGLQPSGVQRWYVPVLNFTVPSAPTATEECVVCVNSRGQPGELDSTFVLSDRESEGIWHTVARWRFQRIQDTLGPAAFYT